MCKTETNDFHLTKDSKESEKSLMQRNSGHDEAKNPKEWEKRDEENQIFSVEDLGVINNQQCSQVPNYYDSTSSSSILSYDESLGSSSALSCGIETIFSEGGTVSIYISGQRTVSESSLLSLDTIESIFEPAPQTRIVIDCLEEALQDRKKQTLHDNDPPGLKFEGISVESETYNSRRKIFNPQVPPTNGVDKCDVHTEALALSGKGSHNDEINVNSKAYLNHALEKKPVSLNCILDEVVKRNKAAYLQFVSSPTMCTKDEKSISTHFVQSKIVQQKNGENAIRLQRELDSIVSSDDSLFCFESKCDEPSDAILSEDLSKRKNIVSLFGIGRRRRYLGLRRKNEDTKGVKLTTTTLEEFNNMNSDIQSDSVATTEGNVDSTRNLSRYNVQTASNDEKKNQEEDKNSPSHVNARFHSQFSGRVSNKSQRASIELKSDNNNEKFRSHRVREMLSPSSISSLCAETDVSIVHDPLARPSKRMRKSCNHVLSDGDVWIEKILKSRKTGKKRSFFYSVKTGDRRVDEPPTGSSKVIYSSNG